ncbi:MAG: hypothetical protein IPK52_10120 [Chloroflexi bacterium]|nr:hypothetical protein [Chloroflexota bacterium]
MRAIDIRVDHRAETLATGIGTCAVRFIRQAQLYLRPVDVKRESITYAKHANGVPRAEIHLDRIGGNPGRDFPLDAVYGFGQPVIAIAGDDEAVIVSGIAQAEHDAVAIFHRPADRRRDDAHIEVAEVPACRHKRSAVFRPHVYFEDAAVDPCRKPAIVGLPFV